MTTQIKPEFQNIWCIVGKHERNKLPHIISCTIGIENEIKAKLYKRQLAEMKGEIDRRKRLYEWVEPKKLADALNDKNIIISKRDKFFVDKYYLAN